MVDLTIRMFRAILFAAPLTLMAGCASGPSASDQALKRVHAAETRADQAAKKLRSARAGFDEVLAACQAQYDPSCKPGLDVLYDLIIKARDELDQALTDVQRAERDLDYAEAAEDRRAARRSASSAALLGLGGSLLAPPRQPVICHTSDTTNPTTICQ
jgi:hypothetical protein